jgi:hypothetical protein
MINTKPDTTISEEERQTILAGVNKLFADTRTLSATHASNVRFFDVQMPKQERATFQSAVLVASVWLGQPIALSLAVRLAMIRFAQEIEQAIEDPKVREQVKRDILALRDEKSR